MDRNLHSWCKYKESEYRSYMPMAKCNHFRFLLMMAPQVLFCKLLPKYQNDECHKGLSYKPDQRLLLTKQRFAKVFIEYCHQ